MNYLVLVNLSNIRFLGPHFCCRGSPLGPHFTQNWVPIKNIFGPHMQCGSSAWLPRPDVRGPTGLRLSEFVQISEFFQF